MPQSVSGTTHVPGKATLLPVRFPAADAEFDEQLTRLRALVGDVATFLEPITLGDPAPASDAAVFPQVLGDAYRMVDAIRDLDRPRLIVTSEFGTMQMWDWEILKFLDEEGVPTLAPYDLAQAETLCRSLALRREMRNTTFVVYQDDPGDGMQASIFKRFFWWEDACTQRILENFGVRIERRSFEALGREAQEISDTAADEAWERWRDHTPLGRLPERARRSALKLYLKLKEDLGDDPRIRAAGINCLNESYFSDTTPCLAWNLLYEEKGLMWGCEADTMSMLTQHLLHEALGAPLMMTNLYPFLMGQAALKHERIPHFPTVDEPENHVLVAHCGYLGVVPQSFSTEWDVKEKVLAIVDDNAHALDAYLPVGPVTLAKLTPSLGKLFVTQAELVGYEQYPDSDCVNGGVIRVPDGPRLMETLASHHAIVIVGHHPTKIRMVGELFGLEIEDLGG